MFIEKSKKPTRKKRRKEVFEFNETQCLCPEFEQAEVNATEVGEGIYQLPFFTPAFCAQLIEAVDGFQDQNPDIKGFFSHISDTSNYISLQSLSSALLDLTHFSQT